MSLQVHHTESNLTRRIATDKSKFHNQVLGELYSVRYVSTVEEVQEYYKAHPAVATYIGKADDILGFTAFLQAKERNQAFEFIFSFEEPVKTFVHPGQEKSVVLKFREGDRSVPFTSVNWRMEDLLTLMETHSYPLMTTYDRDDSPSTVLGREVPCIFMLGHSKDSAEYKEFEQASKHLRNHMMFVLAEPNNGIA